MPPGIRSSRLRGWPRSRRSGWCSRRARSCSRRVRSCACRDCSSGCRRTCRTTTPRRDRCARALAPAIPFRPLHRKTTKKVSPRSPRSCSRRSRARPPTPSRGTRMCSPGCCCSPYPSSCRSSRSGGDRPAPGTQRQHPGLALLPASHHVIGDPVPLLAAVRLGAAGVVALVRPPETIPLCRGPGPAQRRLRPARRRERDRQRRPPGPRSGARQASAR